MPRKVSRMPLHASILRRLVVPGHVERHAGGDHDPSPGCARPALEDLAAGATGEHRVVVGQVRRPATGSHAPDQRQLAVGLRLRGHRHDRHGGPVGGHGPGGEAAGGEADDERARAAARPRRRPPRAMASSVRAGCRARPGGAARRRSADPAAHRGIEGGAPALPVATPSRGRSGPWPAPPRAGTRRPPSRRRASRRRCRRGSRWPRPRPRPGWAGAHAPSTRASGSR